MIVIREDDMATFRLLLVEARNSLQREVEGYRRREIEAYATPEQIRAVKSFANEYIYAPLLLAERLLKQVEGRP